MVNNNASVPTLLNTFACDFAQATAYLVAHLFEELDRKKVEVFMFSTHADDVRELPPSVPSPAPCLPVHAKPAPRTDRDISFLGSHRHMCRRPR